MNNIALWVEHPFQLYSAIKFFESDYVKFSQETTTVVTKKCNEHMLHSNRVLSKLDVVYIDDLHKSWHYYVRVLLEALLVPYDFSSVYFHKSKGHSQQFVIRILKSIMPRLLKPLDINKTVTVVYRILNFFLCKKSYHFECVYCFTKVHYVGALHRVSKNHIAVMESWDHPMKFPYFFVPSYSFTWNKDLSYDESKFQSIGIHREIYPLKFSYIKEYNNLTTEEIEGYLMNTDYAAEIQKIKGKRFILYPTTTSSNGLEHDGELMLIEALIKDVSKLGCSLYIKPKPNGNKGDYDYLNKSFTNVIVGKYSNYPDSRDMLRDDYQMFRVYLMRISLATINCGTTFGLEVACANTPLIQLRLDESRFGSFAKYVQTYHLTKYILCIAGVLNYSGNGFIYDNVFDLIKENDISPMVSEWISNGSK